MWLRKKDCNHAWNYDSAKTSLLFVGPGVSALINGLGDVCDDDDDGILDVFDNCPLDSNTLQGDNDADNIGDICDPDDDNDGIGDACDGDFDVDVDGDGVPSQNDLCEFTPLGEVVNSDGCSINQLNPCDGPLGGGSWADHGHYVSSIAQTAQDFRDQGLITGKEFGKIISNAAKSDCGK